MSSLTQPAHPLLCLPLPLAPATVHRPPSTVHRPPSTVHRPPSTVHRPPCYVTSIEHAGNPLGTCRKWRTNNERDMTFVCPSSKAIGSLILLAISSIATDKESTSICRYDFCVEFRIGRTRGILLWLLTVECFLAETLSFPIDEIPIMTWIVLFDMIKMFLLLIDRRSSFSSRSFCMQPHVDLFEKFVHGKCFPNSPNSLLIKLRRLPRRFFYITMQTNL